MVAWLSAWEKQDILPKLCSTNKEEIKEACTLLVEDDTGDVDEVKSELANIILSLYNKEELSK